MIHFVAGLFEARDLVGLRSFSPLDDVKLNLIALFEALVTLALDGAIVNEHVRPAITAEKTVALCVVEPLYGAFILCQWSDSLVFRVCAIACREVKVLQR